MTSPSPLKVLANELFKEAKKCPGTWRDAAIDRSLDWKLGVCVDPATRQLELRFRVMAGGGLTPVEFQIHARNYAAELGAAGWDPQFRTIGLTWEATFLQPVTAAPAPVDG